MLLFQSSEWQKLASYVKAAALTRKGKGRRVLTWLISQQMAQVMLFGETLQQKIGHEKQELIDANI